MAPMLLLAACEAPPEATSAFSDAARQAFATFDSASDEELAEPVLSLLGRIDAEIDLSASSSEDRALSPEPLQLSDIEGLDHPDRDPALAIPVAVAYASSYPPASHREVLWLEDQSVVETTSPEYARSFVEGKDCFGDGCGRMDTENLIKKEYLGLEVTYDLSKDYRWIELEPGRPAIVARAWMPERAAYSGDEVAIEQSYAMEFFAAEGAGSTRLMVLWAETTGTGGDADTIAVVTRWGINDIFVAYDEWLDAH